MSGGSSSPPQAHVLQLQLSDFQTHRADHLDDPLFAVHGADHTLTHTFSPCLHPPPIQGAQPHHTTPSDPVNSPNSWGQGKT